MQEIIDEMNEQETGIPADEAAIAKFSDFFDEIGSGWSILVIREKPAEYKGFLEEIPVENPANVRKEIDLPYLARRWGGEVLKILLRTPEGKFVKRILIEMRSYEPLKFGKPLRSVSNDEPARDPIEMLRTARDLFTPSVSAAPQNAEIMIILKALLDRQLNPPPPPPVQTQNAESDLVKMLGAVAKMRDLVQPSPEPSSGWEAVASELVRNVAPILADRMTQPKPPQTVPIAPVFHGPPPPPASVENVRPINPQRETLDTSIDKPAGPMGEEELLSMAQSYLSNMPGEDVTKLYLASLEEMPKNKRDAALRVLDEALGIEDGPEIDEDEIPTGDRASSVSRK